MTAFLILMAVLITITLVLEYWDDEIEDREADVRAYEFRSQLDASEAKAEIRAAAAKARRELEQEFRAIDEADGAQARRLGGRS